MSIVTPAWVYEKIYPNDNPVRYTPESGKFRDADWVEPREKVSGDGQLRTYSLLHGGSVQQSNTTPVSCFECEHYIKWIPNPQRATLWRRMFTKHPYWVPADEIKPQT